MDLHEQRTVFVRDGRSFARENGLVFIETYALDATGVDTAFQRILQEIYKTQTKKQLLSPGGGGGSRRIKVYGITQWIAVTFITGTSHSVACRKS
jgi:hypothetical protein